MRSIEKIQEKTRELIKSAWVTFGMPFDIIGKTTVKALVIIVMRFVSCHDFCRSIGTVLRHAHIGDTDVEPVVPFQLQVA